MGCATFSIAPRGPLRRLTRRALCLTGLALPVLGSREASAADEDAAHEAAWANRQRELAALRVPPPSAQRVARRVLCLATAHARGKLELAAQAMLQHKDRAGDLIPKFQEAWDNETRWIAREGFGKEFTRAESTIMLARPGQLGEQPITNALWWSEATIPLLWALGYLDAIPPYDWTPPDPSPAETQVPFLGPTRDFVEQAQLRPAAEISAARDLAHRWHWRARTTQLQRMQPEGVANSEWFRREMLAASAADLAANGDVPAAIDGDFPAFGKPYAALTDDEYDYCRSLAVERHRALNWLCGYAEKWDEVPTDT